MSDVIGNLQTLALERECAACQGNGGWRREDGSWAVCGECDGKRFFPTEFGERVLDLVKRNILCGDAR
jgi:hypothetical protein